MRQNYDNSPSNERVVDDKFNESDEDYKCIMEFHKKSGPESEITRHLDVRISKNRISRNDCVTYRNSCTFYKGMKHFMTVSWRF